jgi:phosphopantothenoylcysteine decarboxylase/phosphopantothenate--cysteine ligase
VQYDLLLKDKKILLGVTGSIAIYKSLELIRLFVKSGAEVRVVLSESSAKFITPLTFEALSTNVVLNEDSESWANDNNHIDIGKWADIFIIAPVTANTINKLSNGIADNLLTQVAIAYPQTKLLAPAANTNMYQNPATQASLKMLKLMNYEIIEPVNKLLACGDEGVGALAEPKDIFYKAAQILLKDEFWVNRRVVLSGGGTIEKIDAVRYISNFSSGKMANSLAKALYLKGADVCLITTKPDSSLPSDLYVIDVENSSDMAEYLQDAIRIAKKGILTKATLMDNSMPELIQKKPFLFMVAAVSDYVVKYPQTQKMKKEMIGESWSLELVQNSDILASLNKDGVFSVGFKAESDSINGLENAKNMLIKKDLDAVCFNDISKNSFGSDKNAITLLTKEGQVELKESSKFQISFDLLVQLQKQVDE